MINKLSGLLFLTISILVCSYFKSNGQCGIDGNVEINSASAMVNEPVVMTFYPGSITLNPNWEIKNHSWVINNIVLQTNIGGNINPINALLPDGFSSVCLRIAMNDSLTGDSCTKDICNIFQSTGYRIFPEMNIAVTGLDAQMSGTWIGGNPNGTQNFEVNWGDGIIDNINGAFHSYAAAGDYDVCFTVSNSASTESGTTCITIHVDNGLTNLEVYTQGGANNSCYPMDFNAVGSTPNYGTGTGQLIMNAVAPPAQLFNFGSPISFPDSSIYPVVPGQAIFNASILDINPATNQIERNAAVFFGSCIVPDTIRGCVFNDLDFDGIKDVLDPGLPNILVSLAVGVIGGLQNYYVFTDSSGNYTLLAPHAPVRITTSGVSSTFANTVPGIGFYNINAAESDNFSDYNFGYANINTVINGSVYLDINQDSLSTNPPDMNFANVTLRAENTVTGEVFYENSTSNGTYTFRVAAGDYAVTPVEYLLDSADHYPDTVFISSTGGIFNNNNFGFYSPVKGNAAVKIFGDADCRPGYEYQNYIEVKNSGFEPLSGTVVFHFDALLTPSLFSPLTGVVDNVNHTITWPTGLLSPASHVYYRVYYTIPVSVPIGTELHFDAEINLDAGYTDSDLSNNTDTYAQTVTGSIITNNKNVNPVGVGVQGQVHHDERLYYRINFQNTTQQPALHIFVQDEIDIDLDMNTFLMERASHSFDMVTNDRTITWKFMNINLPDSGTNELLSHGYVEYSIMAVQGLPEGTEVENTADIYFENLPPLNTNTTLNTLATSFVSIEEIDAQGSLILYPVPVKDELTIAFEVEVPGKIKAELIDINGKLINLLYNGSASGDMKIVANTSLLTPGVYAIRIIANDKILRKVFVKN